MTAIDQRFDRVDAVLADIREEQRTLRGEFSQLRGDFSELRGEFSHLQSRLIQIGFGLVGVLGTALVLVALD